MGKLPDLFAFDHGQIIGAGRMGRSILEIVRQLGFSRSSVSRIYQEYMDGGQKNSDRANCKGHLVLTVLGEECGNTLVRVSTRNSFTSWDRCTMMRFHAEDTNPRTARTKVTYDEWIPSNNYFEKCVALATRSNV
ncbi:uncharacterized protein TNCV_2320201 [Trichonephila clavipes]|nr:uncharacterized protein TNCV_2320201 [Trichonephila clavipes]